MSYLEKIEKVCPTCGAKFNLMLMQNCSDPARSDWAGRHCNEMWRCREYYDNEVFFGPEAALVGWCREGYKTAKNVYEGCMFRLTYFKDTTKLYTYTETRC